MAAAAATRACSSPGAICSGLLAFFADDPEGTPQHGSGVVHLILAFIAFTCITIGAILISG